MVYEKMLNLAFSKSISVYEKDMPQAMKGLYADNITWINSKIPTQIEKACVLAEEIAHHETSAGNILCKKDIRSIKQENRARNWAYELLVPLRSIIDAYKSGACNRYEIAEFLNVTEDFFDRSIKHYEEYYGLYVEYEENYIIMFNPNLRIIELFV